jgi:hypothetical protein
VLHIYAFGSLSRGDFDLASDIDLLAAVDGYDCRVDQNRFSIYSHRRLQEVWNEGNPFAWHLSLESKLIFAEDGKDFLLSLGKPNPYRDCARDCRRFFQLFEEASASLCNNKATAVFDLSTIFLSIRNFASCYSLGVRKKPHFGRHSALSLDDESVPLNPQSYHILERARMLSTRGSGAGISEHEAMEVMAYLDIIKTWMVKLLERAKDHERLQ